MTVILLLLLRYLFIIRYMVIRYFILTDVHWWCDTFSIYSDGYLRSIPGLTLLMMTVTLLRRTPFITPYHLYISCDFTFSVLHFTTVTVSTYHRSTCLDFLFFVFGGSPFCLWFILFVHFLGTDFRFVTIFTDYVLEVHTTFRSLHYVYRYILFHGHYWWVHTLLFNSLILCSTIPVPVVIRYTDTVIRWFVVHVSTHRLPLIPLA